MPSSFTPFILERWQSQWENRVRYNISESGVDPMGVGELLALDRLDANALNDISLAYSQGNGTDELRDLIAGLYTGANRENIVVTTGSAEANFLVTWDIVEPGDEVVVIMPTYMQTRGIALNLGASVRDLQLKPELKWEPDPAEVASTITSDTKLVVVTNPNNPTGHILDKESVNAILNRARDVDAWVLADEVYAGAELDGGDSESMWGKYDRVVCTGSLSKAYGLPGLRIGWVVAPPEMTERLWARHDYTVICPTPVSDFLARIALGHRSEVLERTRSILKRNWSVTERWLESMDGLLSWTKPDAGAICLTGYEGGPEPAELAERLRVSHDILIVPGNHFLLDRNIRLGIGNRTDELEAALGVLGDGLRANLP